MSQDVYQKQDLINMVNHLQAKVNFYKQYFDYYQNQQLLNEELQTRVKKELSLNKKLQELVAEYKKENDQLNEEIKKLQEGVKVNKNDGFYSPFLKSSQALPGTRKTKQFQADAPKLDPWFVRNLRETERLS